MGEITRGVRELELAGTSYEANRPTHILQRVEDYECIVNHILLERHQYGRCHVCFFPSAAKLWNSVPPHVSPDTYDLTLFKKAGFLIPQKLFKFFFFFPYFSLSLASFMTFKAWP